VQYRLEQRVGTENGCWNLRKQLGIFAVSCSVAVAAWAQSPRGTADGGKDDPSPTSERSDAIDTREQPEAYASDGAVFVVDTIDFDVATEDLENREGLEEGLLSLSVALTPVRTQAEIETEETRSALAAPRSGSPVVRFALGDIPPRARMHASALVEIIETVSAFLLDTTDERFYIVPAPGTISFTWNSNLGVPSIGQRDQRGGNTELTLRVFGDEPLQQIDGNAVELTDLRFNYPLGMQREIEQKLVPKPSSFDDLRITLSETGLGWIRPRPGMPSKTLRLADVGHIGSTQYYASAIRVITERVQTFLANEYGLLGHFVTPSPLELDSPTRPGEGDLTGIEDLRSDDETHLTVEVYTVEVSEVRTIARGKRWENGQDDDENRRQHDGVRENSPLAEGDILLRDSLESYVGRLNRHPGRRADAAVATAGRGGEVSLDYILTERKPFSVFAQVSNTGTDETGSIRYQVGVSHTQLTDNDDVLRVNYITSGFEESNAVIGSYEFPVGDSRLRTRIFGTFSDFQAEDVGVAAVEFEGERFTAGGEGILNIYQGRETFWDASAGARYEDQQVDDVTFGVEGEEQFLYLTVGTEFGRLAPTSTTTVALDLDILLPDVTAVSTDQLQFLGRTAPDRQTNTLRWSADQVFFLEPIFNPRGFRGQQTPEEQTLAHEVLLSFRGQSSFGQRLVPTEQQIGGGFFTVRGYEEALLAGDTAFIGTAEYAFHLGRALPSTPRDRRPGLLGEQFRSRRTTPYGGADWDLIFRTFVDAASIQVADEFAFEAEDTLVSAGIGAEFQLRSNFSARVDWGVALSDVNTTEESVTTWDNRVHFQLSVQF